MYMLLVAVAMAMSANAGNKEFQVTVLLAYPETEHAMDKYRCCWGDYSVKVVFDKGMLEWHKIETQSPDNLTYHQFFQSNYEVPMDHGHSQLGKLKGFLLRYDRMQGEQYVSDHKTLGFFGIRAVSC